LKPTGQSPNSQAKGLSISYTDNINADTQTAVINGRVSYLLFGETCEGLLGEPYVSGFGFAPFASSNGTWNEPLTAKATGTTSAGKTITITTTKTSNSALRGGADFQLTLETEFALIQRNYFYVSPFYQTDYRGLAQIDGVTLAWEPAAPLLLLGSGASNDYFQFFWQFRAEAELTDVL
jgi:hypothetical protein